MTSAVSTTIAWPIIVAMTLVVAVRWGWFNASTAEKYLNATLTIILVTQLLRERAIEQVIAEYSPLGMTTVQQLTLCTIVFSIAPFLCVVDLLSGRDVKYLRRQQYWYLAIAAGLSALMLIAGTRARREQSPVEISGGWDGVLVWVGFSVLPLYLAYLMLSRCHIEYRHPSVSRGERVILVGIATAGATIGVATGIALILAVLQELRLVDSIEYRMQTHPRNFFWIATTIVAVSAAPPLRAVAGWLGYGATSRQWRRLRPLWQAMVALFPDSRLSLSPQPSARKITTVQLHRATVEIRDAMLGLRPYLRAVTSDHLATFIARERIPKSAQDAAALALQLATAARDRLGRIQSDDGGTTGASASPSASLEDEVAELLRLARWWSAAQRFAADNRSASADNSFAPTAWKS